MQNRLTPPVRLPRTTVDRAKSLARTVPERARRATDGARIRARRAVHRGQHVPGLLSIVVPCYQVEDFLDDCLVSLRFQHYREIEIIVVDDGSPDRSGAIARRHARRDLRVRVVTRENGGLSAARNTGIEHARGEFLTFVDSDDLVTPDAYTSAIDALRESGSDFVVSCYDRLENKKRLPAGGWIRAAHARKRLGVDLDVFSEAMVNAVAWSKTYRRAFWDRAGLRFPEGKIYEDQPVSAAAFARARAFDVVPDISVSWRIRNDRSSISQSAWSPGNLAAHNESVSASFEALKEAGKDRAVQIRALQLISYNMPFFTRHLVKSGPQFWTLLREALLDLVGRVSREEFVRSVGAQDKVLVELIANDRREAAVAYIENWGGEARRFPTRATPEGIRIELPLTEGLPDDVDILSDNQLELVSRLMRVVWNGDELTVTGWSYIRNIDLDKNPPELDIALVSADGATRVPLESELCDEPRLDVLGVHWHCNYRPGGWRARISADRIPGDVDQDWSFEVTMTAAGVRRTSRLHDVSMAGSAAVPQTYACDGGLLRTVMRGRERQVVVRVLHAPAYAVSQDLGADGVATVVFRAAAPDRVVVNPIDSGRRALLTSRPEPTDVDGQWRLALDLPALPSPTSTTASQGAITRPLRIRMRHQDGEWTTILGPPGTPVSPAVVDDPTSPRRLTRSKGGELEVMDRGPVATAYTLTDETLTVQVHTRLDLAAYAPVLSSADLDVPGTVERDAGGGYIVTFPLVGSRWGHDDLSLPRNKYAVILRAPGDGRLEDLPVSPAHALLEASQPRSRGDASGPGWRS